MAIPDATPDAIKAAMDRFDHEYRRKGEWKNWPEKPGKHKFIIRRAGSTEPYPIKMIIELATGHPRGKFSGGVGEGQANQYVRERGFPPIEIAEAPAQQGPIRQVLDRDPQ